MPPRTEVLSFRLPLWLIDLVLRHVPEEARSAFVVRAVKRTLAMREGPDDEAVTHANAVQIEAFARGWLEGVLYAARQDPRADFDADAAQEFVEGTYFARFSARSIGQSDYTVPLLEIDGRQWVRQARPMGPRDPAPGSATFSVRWPAWDLERLSRELPYGRRSPFVAEALEDELALVSYSSVEIAIEDIAWEYRLGLERGVQHGAGLRPMGTGRRDRAQAEDLVTREVAAYMLQPLLDTGRRHTRRPGSRR